MKMKKNIRRWLLFLCMLFTLSGCMNTLAAENRGESRALPAESEETDSTTASATVSRKNSASELQVHYIDVGQGDATLLVCDGEAMLIDAGDNTKGTAVQLYLQKQGVTSLKYMIGTHPDADHIGGMDVIITKFDCDTVMMPDVESDSATWRDVLDAMDYRGYQNTLPVVGDTYSLGSAVFTIIAPNQSYEDTNNCSIGLLVTHGSNTFLFTGDAETEAENDMLHNGISIAADVLKTGHHGSSTSTGEAFLKAVNPTYAVISCGEDNSYGHPHEETLAALAQAGVQIFRTDEQGSIIATSDGESITWHTDTAALLEAETIETEAAETTGAKVAEIAEAKTASGAEAVASPQASVSSEKEPASSEGTVTYVLNNNTKKFHYPDCASAKKIKESNREETTMTREEILSQGYEPCKNCNP